MGQEVTWLRARGFHIAHAFVEPDLTAKSGRIEPIAGCGRWLVAELEPDDQAERCRICAEVTSK